MRPGVRPVLPGSLTRQASSNTISYSFVSCTPLLFEYPRNPPDRLGKGALAPSAPLLRSSLCCYAVVFIQPGGKLSLLSLPLPLSPSLPRTAARPLIYAQHELFLATPFFCLYFAAFYYLQTDIILDTDIPGNTHSSGQLGGRKHQKLYEYDEATGIKGEMVSVSMCSVFLPTHDLWRLQNCQAAPTPLACASGIDKRKRGQTPLSQAD
ncbi:hypothetical protein CSOJ01_12955 [Colletotrichum sojae]|uniref:Uncharacterized protein n=1 Tax=Colletotrichum sojae TaxID=2175907 RepID=A0A8H6IU66_9PEZI|nr:hypothetical protein CSOJ01_12955 [Colletotrichum sojae]